MCASQCSKSDALRQSCYCTSCPWRSRAALATSFRAPLRAVQILTTTCTDDKYGGGHCATDIASDLACARQRWPGQRATRVADRPLEGPLHSARGTTAAASHRTPPTAAAAEPALPSPRRPPPRRPPRLRHCRAGSAPARPAAPGSQLALPGCPLPGRGDMCDSTGVEHTRTMTLAF